MWTPGPSNPGLYIGGEGGLNWLLNNNNYNMDLGYAVGGFVGYDFVGPRVELEGVFRSNNGRGTANFGNIFSNTSGRIEQLAVMANLLYDFMPGATITPYVGAGAGIAFADSVDQRLLALQHAVRLPGHHRPGLEHRPELPREPRRPLLRHDEPGRVPEQQHQRRC